MKAAINRADLTGIRVGKLTALYPVKRESHPKLVWWKCKCDCGNEIDVLSTCLVRKKKTKSCGCQRKISLRKAMWKGYEEIPKTYWTSLEAGAKERGMLFDVSIQEGWGLFLKQERKCGLTGCNLEFSPSMKETKEKQTASVDRVDSSKGYTIDNIMWVHKKINIFKMDFDNKTFIEMCKAVANFNK